MSGSSIAVTKEGVTISYRRFLSDSAGGFIALLLIAAALIDRFGLTNLISDLQSATGPSLGTAVAAVVVLLGIILLLLGSPVGTVLNGISWFLLGWVQMFFINFFAYNNWFGWLIMWSTMESYNVRAMRQRFSFMKRKWKGNNIRSEGARRSFYAETTYIHTVMAQYFPVIHESLEFLEGIRIFTRNLSFIAIAAFSYLWVRNQDVNEWLIWAFIFLTLLSCCVELYTDIRVLLNVHVICTEQWDINDNRPRSFEEVVTTLIAIGKRRAKAKSSYTAP